VAPSYYYYSARIFKAPEGKGEYKEMRYLVTLNYIDPGPLLTSEQVSDLIKTESSPALEALARLESEGKIRGGIEAGARGGAFILDADSNEEVNQILMGLPGWDVWKVEVTPLLNFETRREQERHLEETLQQPSDTSSLG
jgi:muconolactone delta-isomerase